MTAVAMSGGDMTDKILAEFRQLDKPEQWAVLDLVKRYTNGDRPSLEDGLTWCQERAERYRQDMEGRP